MDADDAIIDAAVQAIEEWLDLIVNRLVEDEEDEAE